MDNKIQTIFEILKTNDLKLIKEIIDELDEKNRNLFNKRFGGDLENPVLSSDWTYEDSIDFYTKLIPDMEKRLSEKTNTSNTENDNLTIYELLKTDRKDLVEQIISELNIEDKKLLERKYGQDLENPVLSDDWGYKDTISFYSHLLPKMKDMLKNKMEEEIPILDDEILNEKSPTLENELLDKEQLKGITIDDEFKVNKKKKCGRKPQTIYQLLKTTDKQLVHELINALNEDEKKLFDRRNGEDLENPSASDDWSHEDSIKFGNLVEKIKIQIKKRLEIKENLFKNISIYSILKTDNEEMIADIINSLTDEEKNLFERRNGVDLHNPVLSKDWTQEDENMYFNILIPKMQRKLSGKNNGSKAGEKLISIYTLLGTNNKDLIMKMFSEKLTDSEKELFIRRNGEDLDNPIPSEDWTSDDTIDFNNHLLPKLRGILDRDYNIKTKKQKSFTTMFELLNTEDETLILELKNQLTNEEKSLFDRRNGPDLRNPKHSDDWTHKDTTKFNENLVRKMRRMLMRKQNGKVSKYLSIYKLLNTNDDILIQKVISRLTSKEQELFWKRNGNDLNNPMPSDDYNYLDQDRFNVNLLPKMRIYMNEEKLKQKEDIPEILDINGAKVETNNNETTLENVTETKEKTGTIEDNTLPYFDKVLRKLSIKEAVITSLKLVLNFNTDDISKFLNIEKEEIKNIVKNSLNSYKTYFTCYIDSLIEEEVSPILVEEKDYIKAIKNLSFGELFDRLPLKDTIILCLSLGLVNEKMYSVDEISDFLLITKEDIIKMNKKALLVYKQIINDNINKVIEIVTDSKTK